MGGVRAGRCRWAARRASPSSWSTPDTRRILGAGIVGVGAGDLIAETVLAIEMGAGGRGSGLTIHPHPTLSETVAFAAEVADGTVTDLPPKRRRGQGAHS